MKTRTLTTIVLSFSILLSLAITIPAREEFRRRKKPTSPPVMMGPPGERGMMFMPMPKPKSMDSVKYDEPDWPTLANCLINITSNPVVIYLNDASLYSLLNSPFINEQDNIKISIQEMLGSNPQRRLYKMGIQSKENIDPETFKIIFTNIHTKFQKAISKEYEIQGVYLREQLEAAEERQKDARHQLMELQETERKFCEKAGQSNLSREVILDRIRKLKQRQQEMEMELAGMQARQWHLHDQIHKIANQTKEKLSDDPIVKRFREIIELHEAEVVKQQRQSGTKATQSVPEGLNKKLDIEFKDASLADTIDTIRAKSGLNIIPEWNTLETAGITPEDLITIQLKQVTAGKALDSIVRYASGGKLGQAGYVIDNEGVITITLIGIKDTNQATIALAETQMKLAERQEVIRQKAGGELLHNWNQELAGLAIDSADIEAQLRFIHEQLGEIEGNELLGLADRYETEVALKIDPARAAFQRATERLIELKEQLSSLSPPQVSIMGRQ